MKVNFITFEDIDHNMVTMPHHSIMLVSDFKGKFAVFDIYQQNTWFDISEKAYNFILETITNTM